MPPLERTDLLDSAVFWYRKAIDGYAEPVLGSPVQLDVRWTDQQSMALDPQGNTISVDSTVVVDEDIEQFNAEGALPWSTIVGGILWHGELTDLPSSGAPTKGIMVVKTYNSTPDIKLREYRRTVGLLRFNDSLPQVVP